MHKFNNQLLVGLGPRVRLIKNEVTLICMLDHFINVNNQSLSALLRSRLQRESKFDLKCFKMLTPVGLLLKLCAS